MSQLIPELPIQYNDGLMKRILQATSSLQLIFQIIYTDQITSAKKNAEKRAEKRKAFGEKEPREVYLHSRWKPPDRITLILELSQPLESLHLVGFRRVSLMQEFEISLLKFASTFYCF